MEFFQYFQSSGLLLLLAVWLSFKKLNTFYQISKFLFFIIPITFGFTILSSNVGRMLLSSFPIVIPYTLIGIDFFSQKRYRSCSVKMSFESLTYKKNSTRN
jgi:hypothetical protein